MEEDINKIDDRLLKEDDRITSYLKGQMSDKEEQAFFKRTGRESRTERTRHINGQTG